LEHDTIGFDSAFSLYTVDSSSDSEEFSPRPFYDKMLFSRELLEALMRSNGVQLVVRGHSHLLPKNLLIAQEYDTLMGNTLLATKARKKISRSGCDGYADFSLLEFYKLRSSLVDHIKSNGTINEFENVLVRAIYSNKTPGSWRTFSEDIQIITTLLSGPNKDLFSDLKPVYCPTFLLVEIAKEKLFNEDTNWYAETVLCNIKKGESEDRPDSIVWGEYSSESEESEEEEELYNPIISDPKFNDDDLLFDLD